MRFFLDVVLVLEKLWRLEILVRMGLRGLIGLMVSNICREAGGRRLA